MLAFFEIKILGLNVRLTSASDLAQMKGLDLYHTGLSYSMALTDAPACQESISLALELA